MVESKTNEAVKVVPVKEIEEHLDKVSNEIEGTRKVALEANESVSALEKKIVAVESKIEKLAPRADANGATSFDWEPVFEAAKKAMMDRSRAMTSVPINAVLNTLTTTSFISGKQYDGPNFLSREGFRLLDLYSPKPLTEPTLSVFRETVRSANVAVHTTLAADAISGDTSLTVGSTAGLYVGQSIRIWDASGFDTRTIATIESATSLTVTAGISRDFSSGSHVQTVHTIGAIAEGLAKPEGDAELKEIELNMRTIPLTMPVSEQRLKTMSGIQGYVESILRMAVMNALEIQMLYGANTTHELQGYLTDADVVSHKWSDDPAGSNRVDCIILAELEIVDESMHVIVMNKADWAKIVTLKDSTGQYLVGNTGMVTFSNQPGNRSINGMPVILTPGMNVGDALILAVPPIPAELFLADSGTLTWGYSGDGFSKNILTARFEVMGIHAIRNPYAYVGVEFDAAP